MIEHEAQDRSARDFDEVRAALLAHVAAALPSWAPTSQADLGLTIIDLLASEADRLAYQQDAVATEAYIGTARLRRSVRRHARLVGIRQDLGCNARTWVHVEITPGAAIDVPAGTTILPTHDGAAPAIGPDQWSAADGDQASPVFETMTPLRAESRHNRFALHTRDDVAHLSVGAVEATLCGHHRGITAGTVLALTDDEERDAEVVVLDVDAELDHDDGHPVTRIRWHPSDRIRRVLRHTAVRAERHCRSGITILGNLVLADHGRTIAHDELHRAPAVIVGSGFGAHDLTCGAPLSASAVAAGGARGALTQDDRAVRPFVVLVDRITGLGWTAVPDLLSSHRFARHFVVEPGERGWCLVRFGDGTAGRPAPVDATFDLRYRTGHGVSGNVAVGALSRLVTDAGGDTVRAVRNVVAGRGGRWPEPIDDLRARAPHAWRRLNSCVTPDDYAQLVSTHPDVIAAHGRAVAATGGLRTIEVYVETGDGRLSDGQRDKLHALVDPCRVVGHTVLILDPIAVEAVIRIDLTVDDGHRPDAVADRVRNELGVRPHLGEAIDASYVVTAASTVPGVVAATVTQLHRRNGHLDPGGELDRLLTAAPWELLRPAVQIDLTVVP